MKLLSASVARYTWWHERHAPPTAFTDAPAAAAGASLKAVGAACRSCHQVYRATDADNNFILKPGSLGG